MPALALAMNRDDEHESTAAPGSPSGRRGPALSGLEAGYTLLAAVGLGLAVGAGIDHLAGTWPWGLVAGSAFFIVAGLYQVVKDHLR